MSMIFKFKYSLNHVFSLLLIFSITGCYFKGDKRESIGSFDSRKSHPIHTEGSNFLEHALGAVVTVAVFKNSYAREQFGMRGAESISEEVYKAALDMSGAESSGSGFIVEYLGTPYIVTNAHVVETASRDPGSVYVFSYDRRKHEVRVLGGDSFYDLAILEFVKPPNNLNSISFSTSTPRIGEPVYAIGNPLGDYPYTVTEGIISALNRTREGYTGKFGFLQTTSTVIWGNSGGPLVNMEGEVLGVMSQIAFASTSSGDALWQSQINFALEAPLASRLMQEILENNGQVQRAYFGIEIAQRFEARESNDGFYESKVDSVPIIKTAIPNSPNTKNISSVSGASVLEINGRKTRNITDVLAQFENIRPGERAVLEIKYQGRKQELILSSVLLTRKRLEEIAKFVIDRDPTIKANLNSEKVMIRPANSYGRYNRKLNSYKPYLEKRRREVNYQVLAGGIYEDSESNIWKIHDLKDLGAVIKLSAINGIMDYIVLPENGNEEDINIYRYYYSGNQDVRQQTLWY